MPLTAKSRRPLRTRIMVTLLCGLLPVMLGCAILYMQAERALEQSTRLTAEEAVRQFELMLDNTAQAAQRIAAAGRPNLQRRQTGPARTSHPPPVCALDQSGVGRQPFIAVRCSATIRRRSTPATMRKASCG